MTSQNIADAETCGVIDVNSYFSGIVQTWSNQAATTRLQGIAATFKSLSGANQAGLVAAAIQIAALPDEQQTALIAQASAAASAAAAANAEEG